MTADEAARIYGRTPGAIRTLASRHNWRRNRANGRTYYAPGDIAKTLGSVTARPDWGALRALTLDGV